MHGVLVPIPACEVKWGPSIPSLLVEITLYRYQNSDHPIVAVESCTVQGIGATLERREKWQFMNNI